MAIAEKSPSPDKALDRDALRHLLFSCLRPATAMAETLEMPLADLRDMVEVAYFQRALRSGRRKGQISAMFGIGMTKAAELSSALRQHFLSSEREHGLPRQLLSLLWAAPLTQAQIVKELPSFGKSEVEDALAFLLEDGRVSAIKGRTTRYAPTRAVHRLTVVPWMARVDGLNTLMDHVILAINARFSRRDARALVRNLTFQVAEEDAQALHHFYEKELIPLIYELDERASKSDAPVTYKLSVLWAPQEES